MHVQLTSVPANTPPSSPTAPPTLPSGRRRSGVTLVELLVVVTIMIILMAILMSQLARARRSAHATMCGAHLSKIFKSLYTYSTSHGDAFPVWGNANAAAGGRVTGFAYDTRNSGAATTGAAGLSNSSTASLWMLIRNGSSASGDFICPDSDDKPDPMERLDGTIAPLEQIFDFLEPSHMSYSMLNPYGDVQKKRWSALAPPDMILMSDNNNAVGFGGALHDSTLSDALPHVQIKRVENSSNHEIMGGQNFLYAGGSVEFSTHPYVGRSNENAFAANTAGPGAPEAAAKPFLELQQAGTMLQPASDSMMIPVTGGAAADDSLSGVTTP